MITSKIRQITVLVCVCALIVLIAQARHVVFGDNILQNSDFEDSGLPWEMYVDPGGDAVATMGRTAGVGGNATQALCADVTSVNADTDLNWHIQMRHQGLTLEVGHTYDISFDIYADQAMVMTSQIGQGAPPYGTFWQNYSVAVDGTAWTTITGTYTFPGVPDADDPTIVEDEPAGEFAFHMGASGTAPYMLCVDNVVLDDPDFEPDGSIPTKEGVFPIRTNQVGYTEDAPKVASYVNGSGSPVMWELMNSSGTVVDSGMTIVFGADSDSGDNIHQIDFSSYTMVGDGYTLSVGSDMSHAFTINDGIYNTIKYDALKYFYHNRSGIEIEAQYTGGANHSYANDAQWARDVAHLSDMSVPCWPGSQCDYSLDVSKGWYDAGDHGKYVVNGGISAWTLMNLYERNPMNYADGTLNIPESGNGVSDILDEVRWEMEFMMGMQVPDGETLAGMAHHKIHNEEWAGLPLDPADDDIPRYLTDPTTAATLNLAATAAQCARIWDGIDAAFSAECWTAAEKAWNAANNNATIYYPGLSGLPYNMGGGPYGDNNVSDEFYWAAAELYLTADALGDSDVGTYQAEVMGTGVNTMPSGASSMDWASTAALGTISLAVVGNDAGAQAEIVAAADGYENDMPSQGYYFPYRPGEYFWGSTSSIMNNGIILGLAYDFTNDMKYVDAVGEGLNYIFGRNAMDQSYVTGHGENPLIQPHHRFWAGALSSASPYAPPGAVSGGTNSTAVDTGDPVAVSELPGCGTGGSTPPQKCFIDAIGSWSTNEITVNWNSPFAWMLSFYDEVVNTAQVAITPTPAPTDMPTPMPTDTPDPSQPTAEPEPTEVPPLAGANIVVNGGFVGFVDPWWADPTATTLTLGANGEGCGTVDDGTVNPWDGIFGQNDLTIQQDATYDVEFTAYSPEAADATINIGMQVMPYDSYASDTFALTTSPQPYSFQFTMDSATDPETNLTFQIGGQGAITVCVDDVSVAPLGSDTPTAVSSSLNSAATGNILPLLIITLIMTIGCTAAWVRFSRN